ncbi:phage tail tape measure protein [Pseudomonas sp. A1437]|uniref:phage tail tape measure protein n=1 Tax=unclassified Pseudomonas TaxID=196821 RepID=UPI003784478A
MTTIAELGLAVNSESAVQAAENLDGMVEAGVRAEQAIKKVGETSDQAKERMLALANAALQSSGYQETLNRAYEATAGASAAAAREQLNQSAAMRQSARSATDNSSAQEKVAASEKKATVAITEQRTQLEQLLAKIDPTTAALARLGDQQRQLEKFKAAGILDPATFSEYQARLQQTESSLTGFGTTLTRTGVSAGQTQAALRQLPAQFTDIFTSLAGGQNPLLVFIQQGGQIKDSFGGIGPMFDVLTQKVGSFLGLSGGVVAAGAALGEVGLGARSVGEGAEAAGEGLGSLAEGANTTTDALKNTKEATDALRAATPPLGIGLGAVLGVVAAVAAAAVALGIAYKQGSDETSAYGAALALTGNTAGATAGQLSVMARAVAESNGTVHEAAASLAQLARSTRIPLEAFEGLATAAANFEDATGVAATETIANFERIAKEPSKALLALNESMNFLTASTLEQIQALERQGKTAEAASLSNTTYSEALTAVAGSVNANLGSIESGWKSVKEAAASAWDVMRNVGREKSFADAVSEIEQKISDFREQGERLGGSWGKSLADKGIAKQQSALTQLLVAEDERLRRASAKGVAAQIRSDGIEGEQAIRKVREATQTNAQKREKEIEDYRLGVEKLRKSNPSSALLAEKQIAQDIANIRAKYKDSKVSGPAVDLTSFNDAENKLKALTASHQNSMRILDASQKAGLITQQQYAEQKSALIQKEKTDVEAAYQGEIAALESVRDKSSTTGAQRIQIDQKIADARSKMVDALKKLDADQEVLSVEMRGRIEKDEAAIKAFAQTVQDSLNLAQQGLDNQLAGFGLSDRDRARLQEDLKIRQDYQKQMERLTRDYGNIVNPTSGDKDKYDRETRILEDALSERLSKQEKFYRDEEQLRGDWSNGVSRAWRNYVDEASDAAGMTQSAFSSAFTGIEDVFVDFITTGKASFKDFADSVLADLARIVVKQQVIAPLLQSMFGSTSSGGGIGQASGEMFGGGTGSGFTDILSMGQKAIGLYQSGAGQAFMSGFQSGAGIVGGIESGLTAGYASLAGSITGNTAAIGSLQAGYTGSAMSNWVAGQAGSGASAATGAASGAASGAGAGVSTLGAAAYGIGGAIMGYQQAGIKGAVTGAGGAVAGAYAGAAIGSVVPIIGTAIGAAIGAILGGTVGSSIWGGEWQTKDQGFQLGVTDNEFVGSQYEYQKKKGGLFGKNKKRTRLSALDPEMQKSLDGAYDATEGSVLTLFDRLNVQLNDGVLDGLNIASTKISTKDKTAEQIQEEITKWFGGVADSMVSAVDSATGAGLGGFNFESLTTFVNNLYSVNDVLKNLNVGLFDLNVNGGYMAQSLSAMAGGIEALTTSASTYYDNFFTDTEKADDTLEAVRKQFEAINMTLPASRQGYRDIIEALDVTTEAGRAMFVTLTGLAGNAASAYSILEQRATDAQQKAAAAAQAIIDGLMGSVSSAQGAVQRAISAQQKAAQDAYNARVTSLNDMVSTATENVSGLTSVGNDLGAALKALRGDSDDAVKMLRAQAQATLQSALATARSGGSLSGFTGLSDALDTVSSNNTDLYGSMEDFARDQGRTANVVAELNGINGKQLTTAEKSLKGLETQVELAKAAYEAQMAQFDSQLEFAQAQMDALNGVDNSVMGVTAAVNAMNAAVVAALMAQASGAAQANTPQNNATLVDTIYKSVLGRDTKGDEAGAAFWAAQLQSGALGYDQIAAAIAQGALGNGAESAATKANAGKFLGLPGYATGGLINGPGTGTSDSIFARLSNGEYVMSADAVRMFGTGVLDQMNSGLVPAFATGGGIGETGPQLEVTGPSRIFNANQTASMLRGGGDNAALLSELKQMREENKSQRFQIAKTNQQVATLLQKWDAEGAPKERDYAL